MVKYRKLRSLLRCQLFEWVLFAHKLSTRLSLKGPISSPGRAPRLVEATASNGSRSVYNVSNLTVVDPHTASLKKQMNDVLGLTITLRSSVLQPKLSMYILKRVWSCFCEIGFFSSLKSLTFLPLKDFKCLSASASVENREPSHLTRNLTNRRFIERAPFAFNFV